MSDDGVPCKDYCGKLASEEPKVMATITVMTPGGLRLFCTSECWRRWVEKEMVR